MTQSEILELDGEAAEKLCDQLGLDISGDDDQLRWRLIDYHVNGKIKLSPRLTWLIGGQPPADPMRGMDIDNLFICDEIVTPDGLTVYQQEGVGLVVSAAEHNFKWSEWQAEKAKLERRFEEALKIIEGEWSYTRDEAIDWIDNKLQ
jgi:hypothetical protein